MFVEEMNVVAMLRRSTLGSRGHGFDRALARRPDRVSRGPGAPSLIITLEYEQQRMTGPPFAVLESELRSLYGGRASELLEERPSDGGGRCTQAGIPATERCFAVGYDDR